DRCVVQHHRVRGRGARRDGQRGGRAARRTGRRPGRTARRAAAAGPESAADRVHRLRPRPPAPAARTLREVQLMTTETVESAPRTRLPKLPWSRHLIVTAVLAVVLIPLPMLLDPAA